MAVGDCQHPERPEPPVAYMQCSAHRPPPPGVTHRIAGRIAANREAYGGRQGWTAGKKTAVPDLDGLFPPSTLGTRATAMECRNVGMGPAQDQQGKCVRGSFNAGTERTPSKTPTARPHPSATAAGHGIGTGRRAPLEAPDLRAPRSVCMQTRAVPQTQIVRLKMLGGSGPGVWGGKGNCIRCAPSRTRESRRRARLGSICPPEFWELRGNVRLAN